MNVIYIYIYKYLDPCTFSYIHVASKKSVLVIQITSSLIEKERIQQICSCSQVYRELIVTKFSISWKAYILQKYIQK